MSEKSFMLQETEESSAAVARLLEREGGALRALGQRIRERAPGVVTTAARGSSDHAATYFKYALEILAGIPVASIGPSVASVYEARLRLDNAVHVTVSQSGASPDIVALQAAARTGGALTVAFVNVADSPVGREADVVIPLHAGTERSVASTKSFVASCVGLLSLAAAIGERTDIETATARLPAVLGEADTDVEALADRLAGAHSVYTAGRGPGFAIALEAALKMKETSALHAEAYSLAELMHGPARLAGADLPVIGFVPDDAARTNNLAALERLAGMGSPIIRVGADADAALRVASTGSGLVDPIAMVASHYRLAEAVSRKRGHNPDAPANLRKVTETV